MANYQLPASNQQTIKLMTAHIPKVMAYRGVISSLGATENKPTMVMYGWWAMEKPHYNHTHLWVQLIIKDKIIACIKSWLQDDHYLKYFYAITTPQVQLTWQQENAWKQQDFQCQVDHLKIEISQFFSHFTDIWQGRQHKVSDQGPN